MSNKLAIVAILSILSLTASCSDKQHAAAGEAAPVKGVTVERITTASIDDFYEAVGTVRSKATSVLSSKTMGSVVAVHVREGDQVRAGQTLIEIDSRESAGRRDRSRAGDGRDRTHD
jgi:multidrug efflux pump subunit AcrA (membrane-fusion protein)